MIVRPSRRAVQTTYLIKFQFDLLRGKMWENNHLHAAIFEGKVNETNKIMDVKILYNASYFVLDISM